MNDPKDREGSERDEPRSNEPYTPEQEVERPLPSDSVLPLGFDAASDFAIRQTEAPGVVRQGLSPEDPTDGAWGAGDTDEEDETGEAS